MNKSGPNRKTIRLPDWDYRTAGYYFITICTYQRQYLFEDPRLYEIAANAWAYIPHQPHAKHVALDEDVIMPNHKHGIIQILTGPDTPLPSSDHPHGVLPGSIDAIVGNYKMLVTKRVKAMLKASGTDMKVWQRGYWERIIRNERELNATRQYIRNNPIRWAEDRENLDRLLSKMQYVDGI
ncbi:MAG: glucose-6-phosphate 1-dehydrogenase [Chloroflexi bacterium]|nr:glucose-6-phosphate 1-dehydrogenase [Chloroflexota bacterium]